MMRPKTKARDLPPRMLRRTKRLKSGAIWEGYYYNGRDDQGRRKEYPLGGDLNEAKRKWAEFECRPAPWETGIMRVIFDRYERDIIPAKAPKTQDDNKWSLKKLRAVFDTAPIDAITPQTIAQYRDNRKAKVRANREIALFSHIWNMAREWGYTVKENPCRGVRKNKEKPRDFYADKAVWDAVYAEAPIELRDAMDLDYLTGQRPAEVLKMMFGHIIDGALEVKPGKTQNSSGKKLRILLDDQDGNRTGLGKKIDEIRARKVRSIYLLATPDGTKLNRWTLRTRFDAARSAAAKKAMELDTPESIALAERIKQFQFRDIRPKAASETDLAHAQKLLGHTKEQITETVYRRVGEVVKPTK